MTGCDLCRRTPVCGLTARLAVCVATPQERDGRLMESTLSGKGQKPAAAADGEEA